MKTEETKKNSVKALENSVYSENRIGRNLRKIKEMRSPSFAYMTSILLLIGLALVGGGLSIILSTEISGVLFIFTGILLIFSAMRVNKIETKYWKTHEIPKRK